MIDKLLWTWGLFYILFFLYYLASTEVARTSDKLRAIDKLFCTTGVVLILIKIWG